MDTQLAGVETPTVDELRRLVEELSRVVVEGEADAVDLLAACEQLKAAVAALQARTVAALDSMRRAREEAEGVPEARRGRGIAEEVALACRESPSAGYRRVRVARALVDDMPRTLALMEAGTLGEARARIVVGELAELSPDDRRTADEELARVAGSLSDNGLRHRARTAAHRLDDQAAARRHEAARKARRVTIRPAYDPGMSFLAAHLPTVEARRVYDSLASEADQLIATGTPEEADGEFELGDRTHGQLVADLLVERVTGTGVSTPRDVDLVLVMSDETLLGGEDPAWIPGQGPIPALTARGLLSPDLANDVELRRLWVRPATGEITTMETRSRQFSRRLRRMLDLRDDLCRSPYCGAPIRQYDHATRWADGGHTSLGNGSGLCQRCNLTKENAGWTHAATATTLTVTTPTGHRYRAAPSHLAGIHGGASRSRVDRAGPESR